MLNKLLFRKKYPTLRAGIGIGTAKELIVKAGRKGSGINNPVWIGNAVTGAANLSSIANKNGNGPIALSTMTYSNSIESLKRKNIGDNVESWFGRFYNDKVGYYYSANIEKDAFSQWIEDGMEV